MSQKNVTYMCPSDSKEGYFEQRLNECNTLSDHPIACLSTTMRGMEMKRQISLSRCMLRA
jgi:hypothetical protein